MDTCFFLYPYFYGYSLYIACNDTGDFLVRVGRFLFSIF